MKTFATRAALIVLGVAVAGAAGCGATGGTGTDGGPAADRQEGLGSAPPTGDSDQPGSSSPDPDPAGGAGLTGGGATGAGRTGGGSTGAGRTGGGGHTGGGATKTTPPSGPRIVSFRLAQRPECPKGTTVNPVPGVPAVVEWTVTGTDRVTLSVDGPGVYGSYPAQGTETFSFSCSGAPGSTVKHTYQLRTVGGGEVRTKTLTASATVYEIAVVSTP